MHFLITLLLVVVVHLAIGVTAWMQVGFLSDDRHMVGGAILRHRGDWSFWSMFAPEVQPGAATALYRPFIDLSFWLEQPWFGLDPFGYHAVNSAMHCGTAMLWFILVRRLTRSVAAGLACALLFVGWPGHSETTHWIASRTTVQSTFFMSLALVVLDTALRRGWFTRLVLTLFACVFAIVAVGTREGAVLVLPLAAVLCWHHAPSWLGVRRRAIAAGAALLPLVITIGLWAWWRASLLGTWGSGTHYGWQPQRVSAQSCLDWLVLCTAPVHQHFTSTAWLPVLWLLHASLLLVGVYALRAPVARAAAAVGGTLLLLGYVAGIGLEKIDLATLENARYGYEPALGLCVLLGLGIAALPVRARGLVLGAAVLVHALVLDGNRESWLRAASLYQRMEADIVDVARATQQPIRVLQAPGVYEGAFALLNGYTEFLFMQGTAPPGTNLRGAVSSTQEWEAVLQELATAARAGAAPTNTYVVQWNDGALAPFALDGQWPYGSLRGVDIGYAWLPRVRPFVDSTVPIHVLVQAAAELELHGRARVGDRVWNGEPVSLLPGGPTPVALSLPLPADLEPDVPVEVELIVRGLEAEHTLRLGVTVPVLR